MSEKELILAVIGKAVEDSKIDLTKIKGKDKKLEAQRFKEQAIKWIESNSNQERSLNWYCNLIDIDPNWARMKIKNLEVLT